MAKIAIKNVTILTMNDTMEIIENGVVVINGSDIVAVGDATLLNECDDVEIVDGENGILMPGMVNAHTHVPMIAFRSLGDDVKDRLTRYLYPLERELVNGDLVFEGTMYGIAEMLLGGVTTFADMYYFEEQVAEAASEMKIRAVLGETVMNFKTPDTDRPYGGIEYGKKFIEKWISDELITPAIAPHAPYSLTSDYMIECIELSKKFNVPLMMHVAETRDEAVEIDGEVLTVIKYLERLGALNERLIAAHMIHIESEDLELLKKHHVGISHNVGANAKGAKGIAPAHAMYHMNLRMGLGTDGPMSGNTLDIMTQMALLPKVHKLFNNDRSLFTAEEVVRMATIGGARALHMEHLIGSIEVGKKADLVLIETKSVNMQPIFDYYSTLVYAANPSNVSSVFVNGECLVESKKLTHVELKTLQERLLTFKSKVLEVASII